MINALLLIILAFIPVPVINGWAFRQTLGLGLLSVFVATKLTKKFHWSVGACFLNIAISGIIHGTHIGLGTESILTVMTLLFFTCCLLIVEEFQVYFLLILLSLISLGDSVIMTFRYFTTSDFENSWWVLTNHSLDAAFISLMLPIMMCFRMSAKIRVTIVIVVSSAILCSHSNTGVFVLLSLPVSFFLSNREYKKILLYSCFAILTLPIVSYVYGSKLMHDTGRFNAWVLMMTFWKQNLSLWFGGGPGSYWIYSDLVQTSKFKFSWMHNDWLQQLFENGVVGFSSCLILYAVALKKSFDKPYIFSMVVGYGIVSLTLYPSHLFFFQLISVSLIYICFATNKTEEKVCQIL